MSSVNLTECPYTECNNARGHYSECHNAQYHCVNSIRSVIMLSSIMLSVINYLVSLYSGLF
jgi:hypothetical protein